MRKECFCCTTAAHSASQLRKNAKNPQMNVSKWISTFCTLFAKYFYKFANSEVFFHYYLNILFCIKCLEKIPDFETLRFSFSKTCYFGADFFLQAFLYISKILPHQNSWWTSVDIFRKSKYCECFFWKFIIFSQIVKFEY